MPFFQNPFTSEFRGNWLLGDRQYNPTFKVPPNRGRGADSVVVWRRGPYDLSGTDTDGDDCSLLKIRYSLRKDHNWATLSINIESGAASSSAVTPDEIAVKLNADTTFAELFVAYARSDNFLDSMGNAPRLVIRQKKPIESFQFYIMNGFAEEKLGFNVRAGISEMPAYFSRHTVDNAIARAFVGSEGAIIELDPDANNVDAALIDNAVDGNGKSLGFDSGDVSEDYELLAGGSGLFTFQKMTVDGSDRITQIIEYHAGAGVGDTARKITYSYSGANTKPSQIAEVPYILESGDLITP